MGLGEGVELEEDLGKTFPLLEEEVEVLEVEVEVLLGEVEEEIKNVPVRPLFVLGRVVPVRLGGMEEPPGLHVGFPLASR